MDEMKRKGKKALTGDVEFGDNRGSKGVATRPPQADARFVALVRLMARTAAERDYAHHVAKIGIAPRDLPEEE